MQTVIDNILVSYEILGSKGKNTILILHGWKNSLKNWEEIGKKLSIENKVILLDLPGMGNSSMPKSAFDTYDYADIINKFIVKLELKKLTLIGHSFGGKIGVIIAAKNPEIKKLILVDISGINNKNPINSLKRILFKSVKIFLPESVSKKNSESDVVRRLQKRRKSIRHFQKDSSSRYLKRCIKNKNSDFNNLG